VPADTMNTSLSLPSADLTYDEVSLFFVGILPGDERRGWVPTYHHRILVDDADVGHINFRVGETDFVRIHAGHIGYEVKPVYRGRGFAEKACRALAPLVARHFDDVILTADADNLASIRTIEKLGAAFIDETIVPPNAFGPCSDSRIKRRYRWNTAAGLGVHWR